MRALSTILMVLWLSAALSCAPALGHPAAPHGLRQYSAVAVATHAAPPDVGPYLEEIADARGYELCPDARLAVLAKQVADQADGLASNQTELALRRLGVYDAQYSVLTFPVPGELSASALRDGLYEALRSGGFTHYGAVWGQRSGVRSLVVVLTARKVMLSPMPSEVQANTTLRLRGQLLQSFRNVRVEILTDSTRTLIPLAADRGLSLQVPVGPAGLQRIELVAEGAKGVETLAKLPVYVGQRFPSQPEPSAAAQADVGVVAESIFKSINRERAKRGLPALERDARLDGLALAHSLDMAQHDFVADASARTGDAIQRVAKAGLPTLLVLESVARARSATNLEAGPTTPAHELGNMLSRQVTHAGIGVVKQRDAYGDVLVATELFVELPERLDLASAAPRLLGLLNEARVGRGAQTVALDQGLCSVALRAAEHFVADASATERSILAEADKELARFSLSYRRVNALLALTPRLQDAASLEPALDPQAGGIGIGVAQGERAGAPVLAIVLILGTRR